MSKTIIISGGALNDKFAGEVLQHNEGAYIIGVDKGLEFLYRSKIDPNYIVGDFDSIDEEIINYYRNETNIQYSAKNTFCQKNQVLNQNFMNQSMKKLNIFPAINKFCKLYLMIPKIINNHFIF